MTSSGRELRKEGMQMDKVSVAFSAWWLRFWQNSPNAGARLIAAQAFEAGWKAGRKRRRSDAD